MKNMKFRIENAAQSEALQRLLFAQGYCWSNRGNVVQCDETHIYVYENGEMRYDYCEEHFNRHNNEEQNTAEYITKHTKIKENKMPELAANKPVPHVHAECIKAWADGAVIQYQNGMSSEWCTTVTPMWWFDHQYRVKPAEPEYPKTSMGSCRLQTAYDDTENARESPLERVANEAVKQFIVSGQMLQYVKKEMPELLK